jgi:UDP-N-acetyl-D-galactosamine dehydrogenase
MDIKIAVIGLGYVGLPLAVEFGKKYNVVGFDVNQKRINELKNKIYIEQLRCLKKIWKMEII